MFWIVRLLAVLVFVVVVIYGVGLLMPAERVQVSTTHIDAVPEVVFRVATDVERQPQWRSDIRSFTVDARGPLWTWTEQHDGGVLISVHETIKEPSRRYAVEFETSHGLRGKWVGDFEPTNEDRTKLTCTETIVIENPFYRLPAYLLLNVDSLNTYLGDLNRHAAKEAAVEDVAR